jgi:hypothetical protein
MKPRFLLATLGLLALTGVLLVRAAEPTTPPAKGEDEGPKIKDKMSLEEQILSNRFQEFELKLLKLKQRLERSSRQEDRERAAILQKALDKAREASIGTRFEQMVETIKKSRVDNLQDLKTAKERSQQLADDLRAILAMLREDSQSAKRKEELKRLEEMYKEITELIREQKTVQGQTRIGRTDQRELHRSQAQIGNRTNRLEREMAKGAKGSQGGEGKDNKSEGKDAGKSEGKNAGKGKDGGKSGEQNAGKGKDGGQKSGEGQQAQAKGGQGQEAKNGQAKDGGQKSGEGQQAQAKGGEPKAGQPTGQAKSGGQKSGQASASKSGGQKSGQGSKGGQAQAKAGSKGGQGSQSQAKGSQGSQSQAQQSQSKSGGQQSQQAQAKGGQSGGQGQSKSGGQQSQQAQSKSDNSPQQQQQAQNDLSKAQKRVREAYDSERKAENNIEKKKNPEATENQGDAINKLEEAKRKLEELLRQLREEEMERLLADLQARCERMLRMQIRVYEGTLGVFNAINANADKKANRQNQQDSLKLSDDEKAIVLEASKAIQILEDEGSAVAFPEVFVQVRDDMRSVQRRLEVVDAGKITQVTEEDIISTLRDMIKALEKAKQDLQQSKGKPGQSNPNQDQKLLDQIAELKMIRAMQIRVNARTKLFGRQYEGEQAADPNLRRDVLNLADRQNRIFEVTNRIVREDNR